MVNGPQISEVPSFASGGVTSGPLLARVGDNAGGVEYMVPSQKAQAFSRAFLSGSRGQAAIDGRISGSGSFTAPSINISTGPVMQDQNGQRWATLDDLEQVAVAARDGTLALLRNPQARRALGLA